MEIRNIEVGIFNELLSLIENLSARMEHLYGRNRKRLPKR